MSALPRLIGTILAGLAIAAQPATPAAFGIPGLRPAFAHGSGGGGGGAGGGGGGGGGSGNGGAGGGNGVGAGHAAPGVSNGHQNANAANDADGNGVTASPTPPLHAFRGHLAAAMGALNAAHAAPPALAHASPQSQVGKLATYRSSMQAVLAMPAFTPQQVVTRDNAIAEVRASTLAPAANKGLTPAVVAQVDHLLGLPPSDPTLGVTR